MKRHEFIRRDLVSSVVAGLLLGWEAPAAVLLGGVCFGLAVGTKWTALFPLAAFGVILAALKRLGERNTKFRKPDDLVFANQVGKRH